MILVNEKMQNPVIRYLSGEIRKYFENIDFTKIEEIRLTRNKPILITFRGKKKYLTTQGTLCDFCDSPVIATKKIIEDCILYMSSDSFYTVTDELKDGYISLKGGIRVGICAKIVYDEDKIMNLKEIQSLNIRIPREIIDDVSDIYNYIYRDNKINNCLVISSPLCGKTTLLRNIAKRLSNEGHLVGICDERNEICATYKGVQGFNMGDFCFSMRGKKIDAMNMMIRSMAPECVMCDEIGTFNDVVAIKNALVSGVSVIASIHAKNIDEAKEKLGDAFSLFNTAIVLSRENDKFLKKGYNL